MTARSGHLEHPKVARVLKQRNVSRVEHLDTDFCALVQVSEPADEAGLVLVGLVANRGEAREDIDTIDRDAVADVVMPVVVHHLKLE